MGYVSLSRRKLKIIDLSDDTQVNSGGGTNTQTLKPSSGYIYKIHSIKIDIPDPTGSTTGTHTLEVNIENMDQIMYASSNTGTKIYYKPSEGLIGTSKKPAFPYNVTLLDMLLLDNDVGLDFKYTNLTDANQTGTRTIKILVEEMLEK